MRIKFLRYKAIIFVFLLGIIAGLSLLHNGFHPTHDGEYHIIRFYEFDKVIREGNLYPRWAPDLNNGYGIPLFNYVYPLPNYVAWFLHLFGLSFIDSFKLQMFFALILSGVLFFLWAKSIWGEKGAFVSAILYIFSPYHILDIYIRGSVGEVWALAFIPGFLLMVTRYWSSKKSIDVLLAGFFLCLLIFSHNILALMFFVFSVVYIIFLLVKSKDKPFFIFQTLICILLGFGMSAIFWLPALLESKYVVGLEIYDFKENFPQLYQLIIPSWGSGFSGSSFRDQMSFQIGIANLMAVVLAIVVVFRSFNKKMINRDFLILFILSFFIVCFLILEYSGSLWRSIPMIAYFQFPWRLLSLVILICSFLAGGVVANIRKPFFSKLVLIIVILAIFLSLGYTMPAYYHYRNDRYYVNRSNFIDGTNSPGNLFNTKWFNKNLKKKKDRFELASTKGEINVEEAISTKYTVFVNAERDDNLIINTAYFPGWTASINGKKSHVNRQKDGLMYIDIPKGENKVVVWLKDTYVRKLASILSLVFFTTSTCFIIYLYFERIKLNKSV